jgi:glutamate-1-semialdehyde 2,1-aminomutase
MRLTTNVSQDLSAAVRAVEQRFTDANPLSHAQHQRARRVLPGGNARQTLYYSPFPLTVVRGKDGHVTDLDGHTYLNLVGEYAASVYGHSCEPIHDAVRSCLTGGLSLSGMNSAEVELAELISARFPSMEQVRFCNSGSEACLLAALLARHATGRRSLLVLRGCYHGGFMNYGDSDSPLSVPFETVKATYNDVAGTRAALRANGTSIAAVLVEPVMGAGGCIPGTREFLSMLRDETRKLGIVLVFDEVMTSRLGSGGVQGEIGIAPDLTTLGKFWGGGFAFGAFGGAKSLMCHFDVIGGGTLSHAGTFNNNIMAMTAGLVGARDVYTSEVCADTNRRGDWLRAELNDLGCQMDIAFQATGLGAVLNMHWRSEPISNPGDVEPPNSPMRRLFQLEMLLRGYYVTQRGMITLALPTTEQDLQGYLGAVADYMTSYQAFLPKRAR